MAEAYAKAYFERLDAQGGVVDRIDWQADAMRAPGAGPGIRRALDAVAELAGTGK